MSSVYLAAPSFTTHNSESYGTIGRTALAFMGCSLIAMLMVLSDARLLHWFVIPVVLCGAIVGSDAVAFLQGRIELMDPAAIVGLLGIHFFCLAPMLHVTWDMWLPYINGAPEWRDWLGWMAMLNLLGLIFYRAASLTVSIRRQRVRSVRCWRIDDRRVIIVMATLLLITGLSQVWVYIHYGGITGYMDAYLEG